MTPTEPDARPSPHPPRGWVLYDDDCGICRSLADRARASLHRRGFGVAALQDDWVRAALALPLDELLRDVRLLTPDGTVIFGAEVYRHMLRAGPGGRALEALTRLPVLAWLFDRTYRFIATHRHWVSRTCGLQSRDRSPRA